MRRVLTRPELKTEKGIPYSRQHIDRKVRAKQFPAPFKTPDGLINLWFDDVIDDYLAACAEGRDWQAPKGSAATKKSGGAAT
jgi:predicted DNA-binding transcriptional regulator AlpA